MMNITKKMVKEATMGLLRNGFKGEIKIFTGKRSFGKVSNLTELRVKLYELASTKNYKVYSIDFGEGMMEVLNFREEKVEEKEVKIEAKPEVVVEKVEVKPNYVLYVGQNKIDIVAEDSSDALVIALEELEVVKGYNYAMNISKNMDLEFCEKQLDCGAVTIATDIWVKNLNAKGYKKVQVAEKLTETQIKNRKTALSKKIVRKVEKLEVKKTRKQSEVKTIVDSFMNEINLDGITKFKQIEDLNLDFEIRSYILTYELTNATLDQDKKDKVINTIHEKIRTKIIAQYCAA